MQLLIVFSRVGVYIRVPGVDAERFAETVQSGGILGYIDALSGGSISRVGIFSLGAPHSTVNPIRPWCSLCCCSPGHI
jgi:preprotein translocase subunit SecY